MDLLDNICDRLFNSIITLLTWQDWINALVLLAIYGLITLSIGFYTKFLQINLQLFWQKTLEIILISFLTPALLE
jgi:predicted Abi (CAAX) family protease